MAAKLFSKFLDYIGVEETEFEDAKQQEENEFDEEMTGSNVVNFGSHAGRRRSGASGNVVSMPSAQQMKMIIYHPISYEDTQNIIDNLKSRKPVIVNMEELEIDCAQRILDFMAGAVYALSGSIYKISRGIFVVAPNNYDVVGNTDAEDESDPL